MATRHSLPRTVIMLGLVSLFMDVSSEMIHSLLPVFLVSVLGVSTLSVGIIEGIAEATASIAKLFSGTLSDRIGKRKGLVFLGYGLSALTKPLFPLANGVGLVLVARFADRIGKGLRGAPRDALIADITPQAARGAAYGLRQSMDTVGAFAGPALAVLIMSVSRDSFRLVFWVAVVPAFIAVLLIVFGVQEPPSTRPRMAGRLPMAMHDLRRLPRAYWLTVAFASALTLARFSEAFLLLRASSVGVTAAYVPVVLIVMNVIYAASAYPAGRWSDQVDRRRLLALGVGLLIAADLALAAASSLWLVGLGTVLWGLHLGVSQGLLTVLVADAAPVDLRGTAFGLFNLMTGVGLLIASVLAGALWSNLGPAATFVAGAIFAGLALLGLIVVPRSRGPTV